MRTLLLPIFAFFCFLVLFATACQSEKSAREKMYIEVMEIHDEVMPEMGTIHRLRKQIKAIDTTVVKSPNYATILAHLGLLEKADEGMMDWMDKFNNPSADTNEAEALKYLAEEKRKISEVRDQMRQSITSAKNILLAAKTASKIDSIK